MIIHKLCWRKLNDFPDLVNCRDFNDRIQWLKLFDQRLETVQCTDKILVRNYIDKHVGGKYLVKLYQIRNQFCQIDFKVLPKSFVIKTNHDSGSVILVKDKYNFNYLQAKQKIDTALKKTYGWKNGEWAYSYVNPKVFVEEYIGSGKNTPPPDYKFYCVNGTVKFCHFIYDRGLDTKGQTVDPLGNDLATQLYPSFKLGKGFVKPKLWNEMLSVAEKLGKGFKCVRIDMYCSNNNIYVGEMTFWPMAGHYKGEGQKKMGQLLDFDRTTYKPFLISNIEKPLKHIEFNSMPPVSKRC